MKEIYTVKGTLVKGNGYSYNLNNKHDAQKLCDTLNTYAEKDNLQKYIVKIMMDISILQHDINTLKEALE